MNRAAWLLAHLTVRGAWSWPTLIVAYALNLAVATVSVYGSSASWWQRFVAVTAGTAAIFVVVGIGALIERRIGPTWRRGVLAIATFALAGASRGAVVGAFFIAWGVSGGDVEWLRVVGGVALGVAVLTPMSLFVGQAREFAAARSLLLGRRDQLAASVERVTTQIGERDEAVVQRIRGALVRAMSADGGVESPASMSADDLDNMAMDVIRPLSHELAQAVSTVELPVSAVAAPRISWRAIADGSCQGKPFLPAGTALLIALLSLPALVTTVGATWAITYLVVGIPLLVALLALANTVLAHVMVHRSLRARMALVAAAAAVVGVGAGLLAQAIFVVTAGLARADDASSPIAMMLILVPVLSLALAAARGTFVVHRQTLDQLVDVDAALSRRLAQLRQVQWSQQRVLARALHGPVQTFVLAGAKRLRDTADRDRPAQAGVLQRDLLALLEGDSGGDDRVTWGEGIRRIEATWAGVARIEVRVTPEALATLHADRVSAGVMLEILGEGVSNGIRHGDATRVEALVVAEGDDLCFTITDDGCRGLREGAGMGSRLLDDCCLWWERAEVAEGVCLRGGLPGVAWSK